MDDVERILPATERRRAWARERGYSARSAAFTAAISLATLAALWLTAGPSVINQLASRLHLRMQAKPLLSLDVDVAAQLLRDDFLSLGLFTVWGMSAMWGAAAVANLVQTGFQWSPSVMTPDLARTSPATGPTRLFGVENFVTAMWSLAVLAAVAFGAGVAIKTLDIQGPAWTVSLETLVRQWSDGLAMTALQLAGIAVAICALDVVRRRWALERSLRMTSDEQREEAGRTPATRGRMRSGR